MPPIQGRGRFDLPDSPAGVSYLAELAEHAIAERIHQFRNQTIDQADLRIAGHRLALVSAELTFDVAQGVADLCDPAELSRLGVGPDELAARSRSTTQRVAALVRAEAHTGLRWWSAFFGEWHGVVLFRDRLADSLSYGTPVSIALSDPTLGEAAWALGIRLAAR